MGNAVVDRVVKKFESFDKASTARQGLSFPGDIDIVKDDNDPGKLYLRRTSYDARNDPVMCRDGRWRQPAKCIWTGHTNGPVF